MRVRKRCASSQARFEGISNGCSIMISFVELIKVNWHADLFNRVIWHPRHKADHGKVSFYY